MMQTATSYNNFLFSDIHPYVRIGTASVIIDRVCREDRPRAWRMLAHAGWCIAKGALKLPRVLAGNRASAAEGLRLGRVLVDRGMA